MPALERPVTRPRPGYLNLVRMRLPLPGIVSILHRLSGAALYLIGLPLLLFGVQCSLASPEAPFTEWLPHRAGTRRIAPLAALHRIAAAIRLRRERDRSRQQLRELNDHLLKDIGLRREDLGFEAPKPPWHRD